MPFRCVVLTLLLSADTVYKIKLKRAENTKNIYSVYDRGFRINEFHNIFFSRAIFHFLTVKTPDTLGKKSSDWIESLLNM